MTGALTRILRSVLRSAYRQTLPSTVRDAIRLQRELVRREFEPVVAAPPAGSRIVVLAPHMDDEVFGCGGALARAAAAGSTVHVVFLTDGSRGYDPARVADLSESGLSDFRRTLTETRKAEARRAGAILGFADPVFLDLPDGRAAEADGAAERLARVIGELSPDVVFLPFLTDPHPDHWAANRLFVEILDVSGIRHSVPCWAYEVWTPLVANTFVDVTDVMARKQEAMAVYRSQILDVDYPRAIASLNAYRSLAAGLSGGYVEAYLVETAAEYCSVFKKFWPGSAR